MQSVKQRSHLDRHLTKVINQKTKIYQDSPECIHPIRGSEGQTSYLRVHIARQAIPRFIGKTPWIKGHCRTPEGERKKRKEREREGTVRRL